MKRTLKIAVLVIFILVIGSALAFQKGLKMEPVSGTATLSWEKVDDTSITGYKIYYGENHRNNDCPPGGYKKNIEVGKIFEYTLNDLEPGQTYYFSVSALNAARKESCFSPETSKKISPAWKLYLGSLWKKIRGYYNR
jgi:hypothetical protein